MSWLSSFLNPGDAYKKAGETEQQYYNQAQGMYQPYMQLGQGAGNDLNSMLQQLMNPGALESEWAKGYEQSPYAQQGLKQNTANGLDAASAMGLGGSSAALNNINQGAGQIMQQDRQNYMNDLMQKYMQGIGIGQNMFGVGSNMANQAGQNAMNQGQWQAQNQYNQNAAGGNLLGGMLGGAAGMLGGPMSNMFSSYVGNKIGAPTKWGGGY